MPETLQSMDQTFLACEDVIYSASSHLWNRRRIKSTFHIFVRELIKCIWWCAYNKSNSLPFFQIFFINYMYHENEFMFNIQGNYFRKITSGKPTENSLLWQSQFIYIIFCWYCEKNLQLSLHWWYGSQLTTLECWKEGGGLWRRAQGPS